jgi:hypothetical protein
MKKYKVEIMRTTWSFATVEVDAHDEQEAEHMAFELAIDGELDFEFDDASDEVSRIYVVPESKVASDL